MNDTMSRYDSLLYIDAGAMSHRDGFHIGVRRLMGIFQTGKRAKIRKRLEIGSRLELVRERDNKYDAFAVRVDDALIGNVGYIEKAFNKDIAFVMDSGAPCYAVVSYVDNDTATPGVLLDIYCSAERERLIEIRELYKEHLLKMSLND